MDEHGKKVDFGNASIFFDIILFKFNEKGLDNAI